MVTVAIFKVLIPDCTSKLLDKMPLKCQCDFEKHDKHVHYRILIIKNESKTECLPHVFGET